MDRRADETTTQAGDEDQEGRALRRRAVLGMALLGATSAALVACGDGAETSSETGATSGSGPGTGGAGPGSTSTTGAGGAGGQGQSGQGGGEACAVDPQCEETPDNPLGPYYRPGAPVTTVLDNPKGTGEALRISGVVYGSDCSTALGGALVEVWQCDHDGDYDNEAGDPGPSVWVLRASVVADACGRYAYDSIKPGRYLNGNQYRPSHIHYRVTHPSVSGQFVTQLYFEGDPFNEVDSMYDPSLEIPLVADQGVLVGEFDVVLAL